tara:strand:+ start:143 stop:634 length:492 start_codon:yes stop_codon:yes gene_type:complete
MLGFSKTVTAFLIAFFIIVVVMIIFSVAQASGDCKCKDMEMEEGHTCDMTHEEGHTCDMTKEEHTCDMETEPVFAVCVFSDGTLIDHKGADSMSDCLKTKRLVEKKWKNKAKDVSTIEINGIEYDIDGEHLNFMCDYVDAQVHRYEDGTWEIIDILGKHIKDE